MVNVEIQNTLLELADALEGAIVDTADRKEHYRRITSILKSNRADVNLAKLLKATAVRMRELSTMRAVDFIAMDRTVDQRLASGLRSLAPSAPRYVYHGTVFRRLASILEHGLTPGKRPI